MCRKISLAGAVCGRTGRSGRWRPAPLRRGALLPPVAISLDRGLVFSHAHDQSPRHRGRSRRLSSLAIDAFFREVRDPIAELDDDSTAADRIFQSRSSSLSRRLAQASPGLAPVYRRHSTTFRAVNCQLTDQRPQRRKSIFTDQAPSSPTNSTMRSTPSCLARWPLFAKRRMLAAESAPVQPVLDRPPPLSPQCLLKPSQPATATPVFPPSHIEAPASSSCRPGNVSTTARELLRDKHETSSPPPSRATLAQATGPD